MKIEKLNENQIRCTLTAEDLASMKLKLSELAYGSKRAQELFRRMMQEARAQCGFNAENVPLMIEAIPMKADSLVLIVTKIEDPEELDLRFSRFTPSEFDPPAKNDSAVTRADDILNDFFRKRFRFNRIRYDHIRPAFVRKRRRSSGWLGDQSPGCYTDQKGSAHQQTAGTGIFFSHIFPPGYSLHNIFMQLMIHYFLQKNNPEETVSTFPVL